MGTGSLRSPAAWIPNPGGLNVGILTLQPVCGDDLEVLGAVQRLAAIFGVVVQPEFDASGDTALWVLVIFRVVWADLGVVCMPIEGRVHDRMRAVNYLKEVRDLVFFKDNSLAMLRDNNAKQTLVLIVHTDNGVFLVTDILAYGSEIGVARVDDSVKEETVDACSTRTIIGGEEPKL
jgi:hypothetical protein